MGIVNLEAMACETAGRRDSPPVASPRSSRTATTGVLVPIDPDPADPYGAPRRPRGVRAAIADAVNALLRDPSRRALMGKAGRERAVEHFSWAAIAERTRQLYASLL